LAAWSRSAAEQEFDYVFTYDRDLTIECAQVLILRIARQADARQIRERRTPGRGDRRAPDRPGSL
jgi:hypothetical protein